MHIYKGKKYDIQTNEQVIYLKYGCIMVLKALVCPYYMLQRMSAGESHKSLKMRNSADDPLLDNRFVHALKTVHGFKHF